MVVTISISGILAAITVIGFHAYSDASAARGTAQTTVANLRNTAERALAEEATYCVRFESGGVQMTLWRTACGTGTSLGTLAKPDGPNVTWVSPAFTQSDGSTAADVYFYPRGSATPGTVQVRRTSGSKVFVVTVEGLTARVSYS